MQINKSIVLIILIISLVLVNIKFHDNKPADILINNIFPYQIAKWRGKDLEVDKSAFELLGKKELMMRQYTKDKDDAVVAIVVSNNRDHLHDPSICYKGQGIEITNRSVINLDSKNKINYLNGHKNKRDYIVIYWFSDLEKTYSGNSEFSTAVRTAKFWNRPVKGMALVVITSISNNKEDLLDLARDINKKLQRIL